MAIGNTQVLELLLQRWWTQKDLARKLRAQPKLIRWHVHQVARRQVVFARRATRLKHKPMAYRVYPQAFQVAQK